MSEATENRWPTVDANRQTVLKILLAITIPVIFMAIPVLLQGKSLLPFFSTLWGATFGTPNGWAQTLVKATPVFIAGMGVLLAFRTGFWNIGAEGQIAIGAFTGMAVIFNGPSLPPIAQIGLVFVVASVAGGLYALIAGWLKVALDINEILTTLMLNFIALLLVDYGAKGIWSSPLGYPFSEELPATVQLPTILYGNIHAGILIGFILFPILGIILYKSPLGFELRAVGADPEAAKNSGMSVSRTTLLVVFISGGLAGLAGAIELLGVVGRLQEGITGPNYGYVAIIATLLAGHKLRRLPLTALLLGGLLAASVALQVSISGGTELFVIGILLLIIVSFYEG